MDGMLRFPTSVRRDESIDLWLRAQRDELRQLIEPCFAQMRRCGLDVRELMHDGAPTACVDNVAFGYVNAYRQHANVGFFFGAFLEDPAHLLQGTGKRMRHVKLRPNQPTNEVALGQLIEQAYADVRSRLGR